MLYKHFVSTFILLLICTIVLGACSNSGSEPQSGKEAEQSANSPQSGGNKPAAAKKDTLVIVQASETRDLTVIDPLQKDITLPRSMVYDTLLVRGTDGKLLPSLAESYEADGSVWRFTLRKGVNFHDGSPLTAQAVKATLDKILDKEVKTSYKFGFSSIQEVKATNELTVEIVSKQPNYLLPGFLAEMPVLSEKQLAAGDSYKTELNGTGPFKVAEWKRGEYVRLTRNDAYWGTKPEFKEVTVKYAADESTRIAELLSGSADIAEDIPPASVERLKGEKGISVVSEPGVRVTWLSYSFKAPFDQEKVRQAVYYGIDRKGLAEGLYGEYAAPALSPVIAGGSGYAEAYPVGDFDPDKAKQLLADAGVKLPLQTEMDIRKADLDVSQVIQAQLKNIGIEVKLNTIEDGQFFDPARFETRNSGSIILTTALDNPEREAYRLFSTAYSAESFFARYGYKPLPEVDSLIDSYMAEPSEEKRAQFSAEILEKSKADASVLWLMHPDNLYAVSDKLQWEYGGQGRIDIQKIKVK